MKKNIAIIMGGDSSESVISLKSAAVVQKYLDKEKYAPYQVLITKQKWAVVEGENEFSIDKNDFSSTINGQKIKFDAVFNAIHGTPGEDGKLQGYFELLGIPYSSSGVLGSALTFSKGTSNAVIKAWGLANTAKSVVVRKGESVDEAAVISALGLPCFVKPNNGGSSFGASKVKEAAQLKSALAKAFEHDPEAIVEEFLPGTEVTCGVFRYAEKTTVLPITEIVPKNEFFDFEAKYKGASEEVTPARISRELTDEIQRITGTVFDKLGLKGMSRIDFIIKENVPYLVEVNTTPGLSEQSIVPQQARSVGISLTDLFGMMIEESLKSNT